MTAYDEAKLQLHDTREAEVAGAAELGRQGRQCLPNFVATA